MGQVLPVFAHCSEYGEAPAWCGAQKTAWGPPRVSIFRARGLEGEQGSREGDKGILPLPPRFGGKWGILTRRTWCNGVKVGGHRDRVLGVRAGRWIGSPRPV